MVKFISTDFQLFRKGIVGYRSNTCPCYLNSLEKEILDRYLEVVLKGNKDGLKVIFLSLFSLH